MSNRISSNWYQAVAMLIAIAMLAPVLMAQQFEDLPPDPQPNAKTVGGNPVVHGCLIQLVNDIDLPATESGVITYLGVKQGSNVQSEDLIAKIDDRVAQQAFNVANYALQAAEARAEDDIEIIYSTAAAKVAREDWIELEKANEAVNKVVPEADLRRAKLDYDRAKLGIAKAKKDKDLAGLDAQTKKAELEASQLGIDMRQVQAPFDGQVVEILREEREWVQAGEPILRLIRLDTLKVEGYINYKDFDPSEIDGCEVTVKVRLGRGRIEQAAGRVVYVDPEAKYDGEYKFLFKAEITNLQENGRWIISPRMQADMTVHLGTGGVSNARR